MTQVAPNTNEQCTFPSLELSLELAREHLAIQREQVNVLDNKANFIIISATTLVSTALIIQSALLSQQKNLVYFD